MKQFSYVLTSDAAQQQRHIGHLSQEASRFLSRIHLRSGEKEAEATQIRQMMNMEMKSGNRVVVTIEGKDEEAAVAAIQNYFVANM